MYLPLDGRLKHDAWKGLTPIWLPEDLKAGARNVAESRYFRYTFSLTDDPASAWIQAWSNFGYEVWVNGWPAFASPRGFGWTHRDEVEHLLRRGENTIAVEFYGGRWAYWMKGLVFAGEVELEGGGVVPLRSDAAWLCRPDPMKDWYAPGAPREGWRPAQPAAEASSFDPATLRERLGAFYGEPDADRLIIASERYVAFQAGGYWAPLEKLPGGAIGAVVRAGACHSGRDGRLLFVTSQDGGRSWSSPVVVADSPWNDYGCSLGALTDGTLIVGYRQARNYDGRGNYVARTDPVFPVFYEARVVRSTDGGVTWEEPRRLGERGEPPGLPYGKIIEHADGTAWMAEYHGEKTYFRVSADKGLTWGPRREIGAPGCGETGLARLRDGSVVAAARGGVAGSAGHACMVTKTHDAGATWSAPAQVTDVGEHPADVIELEDGRLLLTFGRRVHPEGVQVMLSDDGGDTWYRPPRFILTADAFHDHGYPSSVQLDDGTIVTIYYATGNRSHPEIGVHTGVVRWRA